MTETAKQIRYVIRAEGDAINAYLVGPEATYEVLLIGTIARALCENNEGLFNRWKAVMIEAMTDLVTEIAGEPPVSIEEGPAPDHERGGNA